MVVIGCQLGTKPVQIENCINFVQEVFSWNDIFKIKLVKSRF